MPKIVAKQDFEDVYKIARQIDRVLGVLLFKEKNIRRTWKENILLLTLPTNVALLSILGLTTLFRAHFSLISILMCSSITIVIVTHYFGIEVIVQHKQEILGFYDWCSKMYNIEEKYHVVQRKRALFHIKYVHKWTVRLFKWMRILLYSDAFAITILISTVGSFLPDHIYPDFLAPLPYILPFEDNKTWKAFIITVLCQYKCAVDLCSFSIFVFGMFYIVSFCILTYLNIIHDTVQMMGMQIRNQYETEQENVDDIEAVKFDTNGLTLTIREWNKIIVDQINDVNKITTEFSNVFSIFFLNLEFSSFGALFIFGLEMLVVQEQYMYAFGVLTIAMFLFTFCLINEKLMEKMTTIQHALYDIPWYYVAPKDRQFLVTTLFCGTIQKGLTAAGLHGLSIERYGKIVQAAYTNCIILKDLLDPH